MYSHILTLLLTSLSLLRRGACFKLLTQIAFTGNRLIQGCWFLLELFSNHRRTDPQIAICDELVKLLTEASKHILGTFKYYDYYSHKYNRQILNSYSKNIHLLVNVGPLQTPLTRLSDEAVDTANSASLSLGITVNDSLPSLTDTAGF